MNVRENAIYYIKKNIFIVLVLIGLCPILAISYAKFTINSESYRSNEMYISELLYSIKIDNENTYTIVIDPGETEHTVEITSLSGISTNYKLAYLNNVNIYIKYASDYMDASFGGILTKRTISLTIKNTSTESQILSLMVFGGYSFNDVDEIKVLDTYTEIKNDYWKYDYETTALYVDNKRVDNLDSGKYYTLDNYTCDNLPQGESVSFDFETQRVLMPISSQIKCKLYFTEGSYMVNEYAYTGAVQTLEIKRNGYYKLEVWGAEGGSANAYVTKVGGYGSYSVGYYPLTSGDTLYIYVGGRGNDAGWGKDTNGGYNGGGNGSCGGKTCGGGGGGTDIRLGNNNISDRIIVAGGGGGAFCHNYQPAGLIYDGGHAGGIQGTGVAPGTQSSGYVLGYGGPTSHSYGSGGGGGGYYGGGSNGDKAGSGGSGYIGNSKLVNKCMYCYGCQTSAEESTKTVTNTCISDTPTEKCSKKGSGYAKITFVGNNIN